MWHVCVCVVPFLQIYIYYTCECVTIILKFGMFYWIRLSIINQITSFKINWCSFNAKIKTILIQNVGLLVNINQHLIHVNFVYNDK